MADSQWDNPELKHLWTFEGWFVVYQGDEYYIYERAEGDEPERLYRTERTKRTALNTFWGLVEQRMTKRILAEAGVTDEDYRTVWASEDTNSIYLMNRQNPIIRAEYVRRAGAYNGTLTDAERYRWELEMADKYNTVTPMPEYLTYRYKALKILDQKEQKKAP